VPETDHGSAGPGKERRSPSPDPTFSQTVEGFGKLVEQLTPWLLDFGSWIYGALIAFNLLLLASLLTVGPTDAATVVATAAIALALPPTVAGFFLLRLLEDIKKVRLEEVASAAFQGAGLSVDQVGPPDLESIAKERTKIVLIYSYSILAWSVLLTVIGISAALWHMAWWVSVTFVLMTLASGGLVLGAMASWPSRSRRVRKSA
jgi:MFS family permease